MSPSTVPSFTEQADFFDLEYAAKLGTLLPDASRRALEKVLQNNPDDFVSRARLLGHYRQHYSLVGTESEANTQEIHQYRTEHILWFVKNAPDCVFTGDEYLSVNPTSDDFDKVHTAWQQIVLLHPSCVQSKINFALFVFRTKPDYAANLLREVAQLDPHNAWAITLLSKLGETTDQVLPLPLPTQLSPISEEESFELRLQEAMQVSKRHAFNYRITRATLKTQERVLIIDPLDFRARHDILRWCKQNFERANVLGYDPAVIERWYRHIAWMLKNFPDYLDLCDFDSNADLTIPPAYHNSIADIIVRAFVRSGDRASLLSSCAGLISVNPNLKEFVKKALFDLPEWKCIAAKNRAKLTRKLNQPSHPRSSYLDKSLDLNRYSMFLEQELDEDSEPKVDKLSAWVTECDLLTANYEGYSYSLRNRASLEMALGEAVETDLVSVGRLVGTYSRNFGELRSDQASQYQRILEWIVENAPESDVAGEPSRGIFGNRLSELWQKQIKRHPLNSKIAYNAACSLSHCANDVAIGITQKVLEYDPANIAATELMQSLIHRKMHRCFSKDDSVFAEFDADKIVYESNDLSPISASDVIELVLYPVNLNIPISTLWSNEQTLKFNPNDAILRAEVMATYGNMAQSYRLPVNAATVRKKLAHVAWLYKNAPSSKLKLDALRFWLDADFSVYKKVFDKKHKSKKLRDKLQ